MSVICEIEAEIVPVEITELVLKSVQIASNNLSLAFVGQVSTDDIAKLTPYVWTKAIMAYLLKIHEYDIDYLTEHFDRFLDEYHAGNELPTDVEGNYLDNITGDIDNEYSE